MSTNLKNVLLNMKPGNFRGLINKNPELYYNILNETKFLDSFNPSFKERIYCIRHDIKEVLICPVCKTKKLSFDDKNSPKYKSTCGDSKCFSNLPSVKQKRKQTSLKRYGVEHHTKREEYREYQRRKTVLKDKPRMKKAMIEKHGKAYPMQIDYLKDKIANTNLQRYGGNAPSSCKQIQQKIQQTCSNKYGSDFFFTSQKFLSLPHDYTTSQSELEIKSFLDSENILYNTNDRSLIAPYELDIVIPDHNIAIEFNGLYWHSEKFKDRLYHKIKTDLCESKGYQLLHIFEDEWVFKRSIVERMIKAKLGLLKDRVYARKCVVKSVDTSYNKFLEDYHIQGKCMSSIALGLHDDNELVAVMAFRIRSKNTYELARFATSKHVIGGFSKLLKYFQKNYDWNSIITFADRRYSDGGLYVKCGFGHVDTIPPDYSYIIGNRRFHKFGFRHSSLSNKLDNYDPSKSEHKNMFDNGFYRIYDSGKMKFQIENGANNV